MALIQVTSQQLRDKAAELRNQNNTVRNHIESLRSQEGSLSGMWEGEARESFRSAFQTDIAKRTEFCSAIEQYAAALETIAAKYDEAEAKNTSTAASRNS